MKILSLVGARPQFIKEAVVNRAVRDKNAWTHILVHSGQHYDFNMSGAFFEELGIPKPDYYLGVGSGSHAVQTADAMVKFERLLLKEKPEMVLLYGDTNTTLAGAIDAAKMHIPIAHVEAGPRTYNKIFPEEVNRVLTDHISDLLFACTSLNVSNLAKEGIVQGVYNTGDVMYDLYLRMCHNFEPQIEMGKLGLEKDKYVIATIHRDFNTDSRDTFAAILTGLGAISFRYDLKIVLPVHPRARKRVSEFRLEHLLNDNMIVCEPLGYIELMSLTQNAKFVVTDSGRFQKESYWAGKRGLLVMPQGWQEITDTGWHKLVPEPALIDWEQAADEIMQRTGYPKNLFGDGHAAEKIVEIIGRRFS